MATVLPKETFWSDVGEQFGGGLGTGYTTRADEKALQKSIAGLSPNATPREIIDAITQTRTYSPEAKQKVLENRLGVAEMEELKRDRDRAHAINEEKNRIDKAKKLIDLTKQSEEKEKIRALVDQLDVPEESKEELSNTLSLKSVESLIKDKIKNLSKVSKEEEAEKTLNKILEVRKQPGYEDLDEVGRYNALTAAKVPSPDAEREAKVKGTQLNRETTAFDKAYDAQKPFIDKITSSYKAYETDTKPKLRLLSKLATDEELIGPTANAFREIIGLPLGSLDNPNNELFQKTSLDLLKGLPETYGNKILKVEVENFLKTVPSLENSADGRRMIASNLLKLGEMKEVYFNEMRQLQKEYIEQKKPFPKDFEQQVLEQVQPQIDRINDDFIKMSEIRHIPPDTIPFFSPLGEIEFVPKSLESAAIENGGRKIW